MSLCLQPPTCSLALPILIYTRLHHAQHFNSSFPWFPQLVESDVYDCFVGIGRTVCRAGSVTAVPFAGCCSMQRVCCCEPGGWEILTNCCTAGAAAANAGSATFTADVGNWTDLFKKRIFDFSHHAGRSVNLPRLCTTSQPCYCTLLICDCWRTAGRCRGSVWWRNKGDAAWYRQTLSDAVWRAERARCVREYERRLQEIVRSTHRTHDTQRSPRAR